MKKTKWMTMLCVLLSLAVLFGSPSVSCFADSPAGHGQKVVGEATLQNERLTLTVKENGRISLYDSAADYTWVSNPSELEPDKVAFGVNQQRVESQILISYLGSTVMVNTTSFVQSCQEQGGHIEVFAKEQEITCVYFFDGLGFEIPVTYRLGNCSLTVTTDSDKIKETKQNRLVEFSVNPFFGGGLQSETGFVFVPDGSGAIIDFNNGKTSDNRLTLPVNYGNRSHVDEEKAATTQPVLLQGFGISKSVSKGNATFFALVTSGEADGSIITNVAGRETACNYVYFNYVYRESALQTMLDRTYAAKTKMIAAKKPNSNQAYQTTYCFGSPEKSGLSAMAEACKNLIFSETKSEKKEIPLFMDVLMGVRVKKNFLGVPYKTLQKLTTLQDVSNMVEELKSDIPAFEIRLQGLSSNGIWPGTIENKLQINRKIGTVKELNSLNSTEQVTAYPTVNTVEFTKSGNGVWTFTDSSLNLLLDTVKIPRFLTAAGSENPNVNKTRLLIPEKVKKNGAKLREQMKKESVSALCPDSLGKGGYCNYTKKKTSDIAATTRLLSGEIKQYRQSGKVMLSAPASYAWANCDSVLHLPEDSSRYNLCDRTVPFLQMVLSGNVLYSGESVNQTGDTEQAMLRAVKNGSAPAFALMRASYDHIRNTDAQDYFGCVYEECRSEMVRIYQQIRQALNSVYGFAIVDYSEPTANVTVSTYENGMRIVVNFNDHDILYDHVTVKAKSYEAIEKEGVQ